MKERPILFSGPMVRAILDGRKTQTRRVVKTTLRSESDGSKRRVLSLPRDLDVLNCYLSLRQANALHRFCPYGKPADKLWVRETFLRKQLASEVTEWRYAATDEKGLGPWKPSIFMPRWASRITLEITEVRVQRLKDISEADAIAEGVEATSPPDLLRYRDYLPEREAIRSSWTYARDSFLSLWESINGTASLAADPWVWALTFKRVTP